MTKAVYRPEELELLRKRVFIDPPTAFPELAHLAVVEEEAEEIIEETESYTGPTADDLRREAEAFKEEWESERAIMIQAAKKEAEGIVKEAEEAAFILVKRQADEAQVLKREAQDESDKIVAEANEKARQIEKESIETFEKKQKEGEEQGFIAGKEAGYAEGQAEVERLIQRLHTVLERASDRRSEILLETEQDIIDLVLLIARKVVKVITENQRNIIISNVVQALRKVKGRGNVIIRVNMADLKLTTEHTKDFIERMEGVKSIQVAEDSTIGQGGCVIETDFGEIDARISSQLLELETKILEMSPIKSRKKTDPAAEGT